MLELHRASAGSGKTYTLAKKYIWYLITVTSEELPRTTRLRTDAELADSARHILAMTFTNKATNEMQQRILKRLQDLATITPVWESDADGKMHITSPDYMEDFITALHGVESLDRIPRERAESLASEIAAKCANALTLLLENYSDFKISTIDSFFQLVLRTLAYETNINDSYQVELDSEYLSQVAVDSTLDEIETDAHQAYIPYWVNVMVGRKNKGWNMFQREMESFGESPYKEFINSVKRLENEDYKMVRKEVDAYLRKHVDLRELYETLQAKYEMPVRDAFAEVGKAARKAWKIVPEDLRRANARSNGGKVIKAIRELASPEADPLDETLLDYAKNLTAEFLQNDSTRKMFDKYTNLMLQLNENLAPLNAAFGNWAVLVTSAEFRHWKLYSVNLPYLALFGIVAQKRREYLEENNSVELSETSTILHEIIDDSDTPFIYERLGAVLNHFLIDEFQDTSRLQWENLRPLLDESESRGNDNLIIGDAKQSIYRFRNADPSLISETVPETFGAGITLRGEKKSENTNYRSQLKVIQFNNAFFEYYVKRLDKVTETIGKPRKLFGPLYSNVVQAPHRKKDSGYVEVTVCKRNKEYVVNRVVQLVRTLIERGYRRKDIALLVNRNSEGETLIQAFNEYNASREEGAPHIDFVSEQSLKVGNSEAVQAIVGVLENIARGFKPQIHEGDERLKKGVGRWTELQAGFRFFDLNHPGSDTASKLDAYLENPQEMDKVNEVLSSLQSVAIPALVEAVVAAFLPEDLRRNDAVFISAFQDLVLEYCERHPTDIGSFLQWWERQKAKASIASPEETDAVRVLTIHKSKGLEYDCVIIPFAEWDMGDTSSPRHKEWRWVRPVGIESDGLELPPYLPVDTDKLMTNTQHEPLLLEYFDMVHLDTLNRAYVAFTRAGQELYIFSQEYASSNKSKEAMPYPSVSEALKDFLSGKAGEPEADDISRLHGADIKIIEPEPDTEEAENVKFAATVGTPTPPKQKLEKNNSIPIDDYPSTIPSIQKLKYRDDSLPEKKVSEGDTEPTEVEADIEIDAEDLDPRSEGNLKHAILELVKERGDLPRAVRRLRLNGLLTPELAADLESDLANRLDWPHVKHWFDGSATVLTERPLLKKGQVSRRPDRIMIFPGNEAVIVDYKFGAPDKKGKYRRQVRGYMDKLWRTGRYRTVKGYLWYVNEFLIEPC